MNEWQPIETAKKEPFKTIRLWNGSEQGDGYWEKWDKDSSGRVIGLEDRNPDEYEDRWVWCGEGFAVEPPPTHWMPLSEPPK